MTSVLKKGDRDRLNLVFFTILFLRFLLSLVLIEKIYQTLVTEFNHIPKHLGVVIKPPPISVVFLNLISVFRNAAKHGFSCLIYSTTSHCTGVGRSKSLFVKNIENVTRSREDMNFMFEWQEQYLTSERS